MPDVSWGGICHEDGLGSLGVLTGETYTVLRAKEEEEEKAVGTGLCALRGVPSGPPPDKIPNESGSSVLF